MKTFLTPALVASALISFLPSIMFAQTGTALVQHAPSVNGTINGFVQQMAAEGVNLNSGANISGDLLVPGTPLVRLNGSPTYGGTLEGNGSTSPSNFTITLNSGSTLRHVVRRTNPVTLPTVATVPSPTGTTSVTVNTTGQAITWNGLKNLTLNSNVGVVSVPAGTYGNFSANSGTGFKLGVAGATQASVYNFQNLTLNSNSSLQVVGPVVINLANGFAANSTVGAASNPAWLTLNIKAGGYTLNTGCYTYGYVLAPAGTVIVNSGTQLVGGVTSAYLTVNSNGLLKLQPQQSPNQSPAVTLTAPATGSIFTSPASFALTANASDTDGTITKVEFFRGTTNLGEDLTIPYSFNLTGVTAGSYSYFARATDNLGATTDSTSISITVNNPNQPPSVTLTAPTDGATFISPATISLKATSNDADGTIAHVDFYQGSIMIGQSTTAPYQVTTSTLSAGAYVFSAKSYDNLGSITTSGSVTVTVVNPNLPPAVAITAPADGTSYDDPADFIVTAAASDPDGSIYKVGFLRNGVLVGEDQTVPYSFPVSALPVGSFDFVARATDNLGFSTDSAPVRITVAHLNDPPIAAAQSQTTPEETPLTVTLAGTDPDGDQLTYLRTSAPSNGTLAPTASPSVFTYTPNVNFDGPDSFSFKVNDGTLDSDQASITILVIPVNDAPVSSPLSVSLDENATATFTLAATDIDSPALTFGITNGPNHGTYTGTLPNVTYTPFTNYSGPDSIVFRATDGQLFSAPATVSITVNRVNHAPIISLAAPVEGTVFSAPATFTLQADVSDSDGTIAMVEFFQGSTKLGEATNAPYQFTVSSLVAGSYTFTAKATDNEGASTPSNTASVLVNALPVVSITAPSDGTVVPAPASVALQAFATDPDGTVTKVEYFNGSIKLGESNAAPYLINWSNVGTGTYTVTAVATDNRNGLAISTPVSLHIDIPPSAVALTSPGSNSTYDFPATITLRASATDVDGTVAKVEFFAGASKLGETSIAPFQFVWSSMASGSYALTVRATDDLGLSTTSASITVNINRLPLVAWVAPANDSVFTVPASITLEASASDADGLVSKVEFFEGATKLGEALVAPYQLTLGPLSTGNHTFTARATDNSGSSATTDELNVLVNTPPAVALTAPTNGAVVSGPATITLQANASDSDGTITKVEFFNGAAKLGESAAAPYQFIWGDVGSGTYSVTAAATDHRGATTSSSPISVIVDLPPGSVALTAPSNNATFNFPATITLQATASDSDGTVTKVEFYAGAEKIGESSSYPYQFVWSGAPAGSYALTVRATDNLGLTTTSAPIAVTINTPPEVSLSAPANNSVFNAPASFTLQAIASDADGSVAKVEFFDGPTRLGESLTSPYQFPVTNLAPGSHSFTAQATDNSGATSISSAVTILSNALPMANPQNVSVNEASPTSIFLTGNDPEGDSLTYTLIVMPIHGALTGSAPNLTYAPVSGYTGDDSFSFKVNDGHGDSATATVSLAIVPMNSAPIVSAGSDQLVHFSPFSSSEPSGRIVVNNDEWVLTDSGFSSAPNAKTFALNLAKYLTGDKRGAKFLAYTNVIPGSVDFIYTGSSLAATMTEAGYSWETNNAIPMTLANLQQYDAVFLGANVVDNQILIDYVESGGSVYLSAGTHWCGCDADIEAALWNPFLEHFGLHYNSPYNNIIATLPVESDHPLFAGIQSLYIGNGNSVSLLNNQNPYAQIPFVHNGQGIFGAYGGTVTRNFLYGSVADDGRPNPPATLTYQWSQISGPPSGAIIVAPNSAITRVIYDLPGAYVFRLSATDGAVTSFDDVSIVVNTPPQAYAGPQQTALTVGDPVQLQGTTSDDGFPVSPGLRRSWSVVSGPGDVNFVDSQVDKPYASFTSAGLYVLKLTATDGFDESADYTEVRVGTTLTATQPSGLVAWWPGNYYNREFVQKRDEAGRNVAFEDGKVGGAYSFGSTNRQYVNIPKIAGQTDIGNFANGFTMEFWVKIGSGAWRDVFGWADGTSMTASIFANYDGSGGFDLDFNIGNSIWRIGRWNGAGQWQHVGVTYDQGTGQMMMYLDGELQNTYAIDSAGAETLRANTDGEIYLGGLLSKAFVGSLDELSFYNRALSRTEIQAIYSADVQGKAPISNNHAPMVTAGLNQTVMAAGGATTLLGSVTDDGLPIGQLDLKWTQLFGPATAVLGTATQEHTVATLPAAGIYGFKLTASDGLFTRSDAVEVRVGTTFTGEQPAGLAAWWPGNYYNRELVQKRDETGRNVVFEDGKVGGAYSFSGTSGQYVFIPKNPGQTDIGSFANGFTMEFWVKIGSGAWRDVFGWADGTSMKASIFANYDGSGGFDLDFNVGNSIWRIGRWNGAGQWQHVGVTYSREAGQMLMYLDGELRNTYPIDSAGAEALRANTGSEIYLGGLLSKAFAGSLDELSFYNRALSRTEIQAIYTAGAQGKTPISNNNAPIVTAGSNQTVMAADGTTTLLGGVTDDGLPIGQLDLQWVQLFGPATAVLGTATQEHTVATFPAAGIYGFKLTASDGLFTRSDAVEVRVGVPVSAAIPRDQSAWWPFNVDYTDVLQGIVAEPRSAHLGAGFVGQALDLNGTSAFAASPGSNATSVGSSPSSSGATIELWMKMTDRSGDRPLFSWTDGPFLRTNYFSSSLQVGWGKSGGGDDFSTGFVLTEGLWYHCAATYDRASGVARLYLNGVLQIQQDIGSFPLPTTGEFLIGARAGEATFKGQLDEVTLYDRPLTPDEIAAIYNSGADGKPFADGNSPPEVNAGPDVSIASIDEAVQLSASVSDDGQPFGLGSHWHWTKLSGPGTVSFGRETGSLPELPATTANFTASGIYVLKLEAQDGALLAIDTVKVRVGQIYAATIPTDVKAWWPADGDAQELISGKVASGWNMPGFIDGKVAQAFDMNGTSKWQATAQPNFAVGSSPSSAGATVELWMKMTDRNGDRPLVSWNDGPYLRTDYFSATLQVGWGKSGGGDIFSTGFVLSEGLWYHCAATYDRASGMARLYVNGILQTQQNIGSFALPTTGDFFIGARPGEVNFKGQLDEVTLYDRPLTPEEIAAIYNSGAAGKPPFAANEAPSVTAGSDQSAYRNTPLTLTGSATDDGLPNPPAALTYQWSALSSPVGSGPVVFSAPTALTTSVSFGTAGTYTLRLSASDSVLSATDDVIVTVASHPPSVAISAPANNATVLANASLSIVASAADIDGTVTTVEFFDGANKLGERTAPDTAGGDIFTFTQSAGFPVGTHSLTAKATDNSGLLTTSNLVAITCSSLPPVPPTIFIFEPLPGPSVLIENYFEIAVTAVDSDGSIAKVEFFQDGTPLGEQIFSELGHPTTYFWPMFGGLPAGTYTFTAKATDNSGLSTTSAPVTVEVTATPSSASSVYIATPDDDTRVSAPTPITGLIVPPALTSWSLQYRLRPAGDDTSASPDPWLVAASGTSAIGTAATADSPAAPDVIGTFDPTSLVNGLYELRLAVTTSTSTITTHPLTLIVEGNMKVGAFSLAFEDLKVPVAGIPISLVRTYDSRDTRAGDFGPGWRLAVNNIRVQKNRNLGKDWYQTEFPGFNPPPFYPFYIEPVNERIVTVTMPDGETHRFRAGADVTNSASRPGDPVNLSLSVPSSTGKYRFYPMGDTTSKLESLDSSNQLAETFYNESYGTQDLTSDDPSVGGSGTVFNPTRFRLTTKDGTKYIVDEKLGLMRLEDLNGNTLVLNRDAQDRVTTIVSQQALPSAGAQTPDPITIVIHRDATGRVDYITDLAGATLDYLYDTSGRLESFTNRTDDTTQFKYENPSFPYYLTKIIDPRGVTALRSEFDENGKLFKQIDADGKETIFNRGIDAGGRFEKIKDRLGHETTFYYDDRGNVTTKIDSLNAITSFSYYPDSDRVKFETDHYGNTKSMAYDARGNVTVQTIGASLTEDPANPTTGYTTRTTYNDRSAPTAITDPEGRVQSFGYDAMTGNLLSNTVGGGGTAPATTTYHYNTDGTLDTITDALGNVTQHTYNYSFSDPAYPTAVKQLTVTISELLSPNSYKVLRETRTLYDAQENMLATIATRTLPAGGTEDIVTKYVYDAENRLTATIMPDNKVSETRYTSFGQTDKSLLWKSVADYTSQDDSRARVTSYGYDNRGNQTSTTYPDGTSESSHLDLENRRDWSQDRLGHRTYFKYDDVGRLRFTIQPDATPGDLTDNPATETVYDLTGRVTDTYDELRHRTTVTYFPDGTPDAGRRKESIQVLSTGNLTTSYQYDATGAVRFVIDPRGNTTETRYDDQGRPTTVIFPATDEHPSTQSSTKYDILGRRIETVDQEGKTTRYRYDGLGRLFEVHQYLDAATATADANLSLPTTHSSLVATRYSFDELGHQMSQTDARNNTTNYRYDSLGRRTQRILPDNSTENLQYDEWGNLWKRTDFKGYTTTFGYDVLNRLKTRTADATHPSLIYSHAIARVEYDYDAAGARTAARTYNATSTTPLYTESTPRDERGRLDSKTNAVGTLDYDYFANGLLKDVVSSNSGGANVGYRYDEANRLAYVDDASSGTTRTTSYSYNGNGSLETVLTPNGVMHDYQYDTLNRLRTLSVTNTLGTLRSYTYALNPSGHRKKITENTGRTADYLYDGLYRLTSETIAGAIGQNGTIGYTLDKVGNREVRTSSVGSIPSVSSTFNNRDWLSGDSFDLNGNTLTSTQPLAIVAQPDVYDFEDRLIIRHKTDGSSINFAYDADGLLRSKTVLDLGLNPVRTTQRLIDTNNLTGYAQVIEEYQITAAGTTATIYTYGSDLISQSVSLNSQLSTLNYFTYDGLGSVRTLTDAAGTVTDTWDYDAFGNTIARTGTTDNAYLYRGEQYDADLGMYYLRARFYNQATGRFWNQDSYEGSSGDPASLHKYLYANGDPVGRFDPSGNVSLAEVQIGMVIVGTLNAMAINSMRNTLHQIRDIFNPEGDEAEAFDNIDTLMFAGEVINAGVAIYGGISIVRGLISKLPGAINTLKNVDWSRIVKMRLGLGSVAQKVARRLVVQPQPHGVIKIFDPISGSHITGYGSKDGLFIMNVHVAEGLRKQGVSVELYRKLLQNAGGDKIRQVWGTPAGPNLEYVWAGELAKAPRVRALEKLGFTQHSTDDVSYILSER